MSGSEEPEGRVAIDELDGRLIELFTAQPRIGVLEASRRLKVARGTVQARLDRLARDGVIAGYGPEIDAAALGYGVTAFVTLQLRQAGGHDPVGARLAQVPEVIEAHTITGPGDMLCRVVARSNTDLQRVIDVIVDVAGVERASSVISLATQVPYRTLPLVRAASTQRAVSTQRATSTQQSASTQRPARAGDPSRHAGSGPP
ncbi:winged helix-turn-helix transcriptional regulator [Actinomadura sp. KC06]|uniref:Lrp/AsnC family transcriptional regulator n=1 Tax=Actinomadura sp. KC06 TaxID=2530369 RepID=UPI001044B2A3|nr:Lrp/AsnC family transcriptional regulator [Actinomadura sp. KC06]TDD32409.1 winged helix-turn-helix transcriptional regulator [Actinomadura sp. KC06]